MFHNVADLICTEASPSPSPIEKFFEDEGCVVVGHIGVGSTVEVSSSSELLMLDEEDGDGQLMAHAAVTTITGSSFNDMLSSPLSALSDASSGYESVTTLLSSTSSSIFDNDCEYQSISQEMTSQSCQSNQTRRPNQELSCAHHQLDSSPDFHHTQPSSTIGHLDHNMLRDIRIPKQMVAIEDRYIPWDVVDLVYENEQYEVNLSARRILTEWMLDVCEEMKCEEAIFPLAVNYLDRFLMLTPTIHRYQLQLVGVVCMLIASKLRQFIALDPAYLSQMTDYSVTVKEILEWEPLVLNRLKWDVASVVATDYLDHILVILSQIVATTTGQLEDYDCGCPSPIETFNCCSQTAPSRLSQPLLSNGVNCSGRITPTSSPISSSFVSTASSQSASFPSSLGSMPAILSNQACSKRQRTDGYEYDYDHFNHQFIGDSLSHTEKAQCRQTIKKIRYDHPDASVADQPAAADMDDDDQRHQSFEDTIRRHANTFITLCATEMQFVCVKPSVIATACVATSIRGIYNQNKQKRQQQSCHHCSSHRMALSHSVNGPLGDGCVVSEVDQYQHFLRTIENKFGIDMAYVEHTVDRIEALFAFRSSNLSTSSSSSKFSSPSSIASATSAESKSPINSSQSSFPSTLTTTTTTTPSSNAINPLAAPVNHSPVKSQHNSNLYRAQPYSHHSHSQQHSLLHSNTPTGTGLTSSTSNYHHHHHQFVHTSYAQVPNTKQLLLLATAASTVADSHQQSVANSVRTRRTSHPNHLQCLVSQPNHYIPSSSASLSSSSSLSGSFLLHDASHNSTNFTSSFKFKQQQQSNCTSTIGPNQPSTALVTEPVDDHLNTTVNTITANPSNPGIGFHNAAPSTLFPAHFMVVSSPTYQNDENRENIPIRIVSRNGEPQPIVSIDSNRNDDNRMFDTSSASSAFYSLILDDDSIHEDDASEEDYRFY